MLVLWSVKSECYYSKTIIKTQPASCFVFFSFFGPSLHCFEYHVCIYILVMCSSLECDLFARRDLWFVFNVESQQQQQKCSSTEQHVILGGGGRGGILLTLPASGPYSSTENHIVWIHIKPFMSDCLNCCGWSSPEMQRPPGFADTRLLPFEIPPPRLSALYDDIFIFFLKRKDCVRFWVDVARTRGPIPASLRGVNDIYSVYFLHAVHINPRRCRYTTHIMFHSCIVFFFPGNNIYHALASFSYRTLPPREI